MREKENDILCENLVCCHTHGYISMMYPIDAMYVYLEVSWLVVSLPCYILTTMRHDICRQYQKTRGSNVVFPWFSVLVCFTGEAVVIQLHLLQRLGV